MVDPKLLTKMEWRLVGPFRGGRVVAVAGDPSDMLTFYFGSTGGGVWKTRDGGQTWNNVSDGFFHTASVGALAMAASDPNVIYAGMGETTIRGNVSHGDGVYKSTDAGRTWTHCGLAETRHIAKVRIHPRNPNLVYVAAFGHVFGSNHERGVYRSKDGGQTWERILFRSEEAGAIDLAMDPHNPRILYAAFWDAHRTPYTLSSGGPGSGLFKSTDGGETWSELTRNPGLPKGIIGKIGVAVSPAKTGRVWALVEAADGGLFRSDDGGATWEKMSDNAEQRQRPWYYTHVIADPQDSETVWVPNVHLWKSTDGGRSFVQAPTPHGDDHDLWIDPRDTRRMIEGNDGGAVVSFNGGGSWSSPYNQPTAEFYHVTTDNAVPYRLYGAQQDNTTITTPSRSDNGAITWADCYPVGGGESGYIAVKPDDPNLVYAGSYWLITRYDRRTHQSRNIMPWPENPMGWSAQDLRYRFQWTFPIVISPHDPDTLYAGANHLFRSHNEGKSWEIISPDLTRNDPRTMGPSGGPITKDNTSVEYYGTIFAFAESPVERGILWAGSDDGLVHLSRDNGKKWEDVTPKDLPEWALISIIEPSPHDAGTVYVAATRYKSDDFRPYLYKTDDYGKTWTKITDGIPEHAFTRVIRADPNRTGLLYAGTETGAYVSLDDGAHWQPFQQNLPVVPIHDLAVKETDLIAATHGRAFWILDDLTPLYGINDKTAAQSVYLFQPRPTIRFKSGLRRSGGEHAPAKAYLSVGGLAVTTYQAPAPGSPLTFFEAGRNPTDGVAINYYLREKPEGEVNLTFLDASGNEIKTFTSEEQSGSRPVSQSASSGATSRLADSADLPTAQPATADARKKEPQAPAEAGMNRFVWNMRYPDARTVPGAIFWAGGVDGPLAPPGTYQVRLTVGEVTQMRAFTIRKDPRVPATQADYDAQFHLLLKIRDRLSETHDGINRIRDVRAQIEEWEHRAAGSERSGAGSEASALSTQHAALREAATALKKRLAGIEEELIQVRSKAMEDPLNFPIKLNNKLASLSGAVASADAAPTRQEYAVYDDLSTKIGLHLITLATVIDKDVSAFNRLLGKLDIPAIVPPTRKEG